MLPVEQFTDFNAQNCLFTSHDKVLAAVSGGMDSVLMVHLLKAAEIDLAIAHCNFQLRGDESIGDQEFCNALAQQLQVPFHTINFDTLAYSAANKISTQMAARDLRYKWFEQIRQQYNYKVIALAHHQNDAIETILLNLIRGTGIAGLHGISAKNGLLVRPMLFLTRDEIAAIITDNKLNYREDSSNAFSKYARNKIRLEVIPKLKELNPSLEQTFEGNLQHFKELETLLEHKVVELKKELFTTSGNEVRMPIDRLKKLVPQKLLLYNLLQPFGVNNTIISDIIASLDKHAGRAFGTASHQIMLDREHLIIAPITPGIEAITIRPHDREIKFGNYRLNILHDDSPLIIKDNPLALSVDRDLLIYPLMIRTWKDADFFYPFGMRSRKKLSDFFIGQKVPLHQKREIPILINGNDEIIWIAGYRPDDRYKVSADTKKVTIFELVKMPFEDALV